MHKKALIASLVLAAVMIGCGDRSAPPVHEPVVSLNASQIAAEQSYIETTEDYANVTLLGEYGSKVFINGELVGTIPESGTLEVSFEIKDVGDYSYAVHSESPDGVSSEKITIEISKNSKSASLGTVATKGDAANIELSKDGIIFVAEKNQGVEVISIGYDDKISSEIVSSVEGINAVNVVLSDDEQKLYIEDERGRYHIMDISDISHPVETGVVENIDKKVTSVSEDGATRFRLNACGLVSEDITNSTDIKQNFLLKDQGILDIALVDHDSKLIVAHGMEGLQLYDVSDPSNPVMIGEKDLGDNTSGLSLLLKDGILFVANGSKGVEIFDLDILLFEMEH